MAFLSAFAECGNISDAAGFAGVDRRTHYNWLDADADYRARFLDAEATATDALEREARRRAIEGVEEPVGFYQGQASEYVRRYSDVLLIFLLKARRPELYRERHEHVLRQAEQQLLEKERARLFPLFDELLAMEQPMTGRDAFEWFRARLADAAPTDAPGEAPSPRGRLRERLTGGHP